MRKSVASGLMVGLAMALGCSAAPHDPIVESDFLTRRSIAQLRNATSTRVDNATGSWPALSQSAPAVTPPQAAPVAAQLPAEAPGTATPFQMPEAYGVRVYPGKAAAGQSACVLPPAPTRAMETPPAVPLTKPAPEVVLLGVGGELPEGVVQTSWPPPPQPNRPTPAEVAPELRTPGDIPTRLPDSPPQAGFGHAPDYSWLTGEVEHIRARNVWRLRYAPADQEDRYGGTVVLVGDGLPADRHNGQIVRVEGQLVNPDTSEARPPYWVRSFQLLKAAPPLQE